MEYILTTSGLSFADFISYPDIKIKTNTSTFISGESGSGKSTLLRLLNSTKLPSSGDIFYCNQNIKNLDKLKYRREVLLATQEIYLTDDTIRDNFDFYYMNREMPPISDDRIKEALELCCINMPVDASCKLLSGGERQRIFLAIMLSFAPKVLLLDEPTSALDDKTAKQLLTNIKNHCAENKITLVVVSHSRELTEMYADEQIELSAKRSIE